MNGRLSTQDRSMAEEKGDDSTRAKALHEGLELIQVDIECYVQVTILFGLFITGIRHCSRICLVSFQ